MCDVNNDLTIDDALKWCHDNNVEAQFYSSHVELIYGSGYYKSSEVEFLDAVKSLKVMID